MRKELPKLLDGFERRSAILEDLLATRTAGEAATLSELQRSRTEEKRALSVLHPEAHTWTEMASVMSMIDDAKNADAVVIKELRRMISSSLEPQRAGRHRPRDTQLGPVVVALFDWLNAHDVHGADATIAAARCVDWYDWDLSRIGRVDPGEDRDLVRRKSKVSQVGDWLRKIEKRERQGSP